MHKISELYTMDEIDKAVNDIYKPDFRAEALREVVKEYAPNAISVIERQLEGVKSLKRKNKLILKKKYWEDTLSRARV